VLNRDPSHCATNPWQCATDPWQSATIQPQSARVQPEASHNPCAVCRGGTHSGDVSGGIFGLSGKSWYSVKPIPYSIVPLSVRLTRHLHLLKARVARLNAAVMRPTSIYKS
jgi:hypothetical protein